MTEEIKEIMRTCRAVEFLSEKQRQAIREHNNAIIFTNARSKQLYYWSLLFKKWTPTQDVFAPNIIINNCEPSPTWEELQAEHLIKQIREEMQDKCEYRELSQDTKHQIRCFNAAYVKDKIKYANGKAINLQYFNFWIKQYDDTDTYNFTDTNIYHIKKELTWEELEEENLVESMSKHDLLKQLIKLKSNIKSFMDLSKYEESLLSEYNTRFIKDKIKYIDGIPVNLEFWSWGKSGWVACEHPNDYNPTYWIYRIKKEPTVLFAGTPGGMNSTEVIDILNRAVRKIDEPEESKFKVGDKVRLVPGYDSASEGIIVGIQNEHWYYVKLNGQDKVILTAFIEPISEPKLKVTQITGTLPMRVRLRDTNGNIIPETYAERQAQWVKENNVKVGDKVKLVSTWKDNEQGFDVRMNDAAKMLGKVSKIIEILPTHIRIDNGECFGRCFSPYFVPYFALELQEPTTFFQVDMDTEQPPVGATIYLSPLSLIIYPTGATCLFIPKTWQRNFEKTRGYEMSARRLKDDTYEVNLGDSSPNLIRYVGINYDNPREKNSCNRYVVSKIIGLKGTQHTAVLDKKNIFQSIVDYLRRLNEAKR